MRRAWFVACIALILATSTLSPVASAQPALHVVDTGVIAQFPGSLRFTVLAESPHQVTDVRLLYQIDKMNYARVTSESWASFEPGTSVNTSWTWDMRWASLPPGARITYWWRVRDAGGGTVESAPATVTFDDDRHDWMSVESDDVTLHWYYGSESFARELLAVCDQAIESLAQDVGARVDRRITVYIYQSSADLRQDSRRPRIPEPAPCELCGSRSFAAVHSP